MFFKKRGKVFDRESLKKAIETAKEIRSAYDEMATNEKSTEQSKKKANELGEMFTVAIEAMKTILYDL